MSTSDELIIDPNIEQEFDSEDEYEEEEEEIKEEIEVVNNDIIEEEVKPIKEKKPRAPKLPAKFSNLMYFTHWFISNSHMDQTTKDNLIDNLHFKSPLDEQLNYFNSYNAKEYKNSFKPQPKKRATKSKEISLNNLPMVEPEPEPEPPKPVVETPKPVVEPPKPVVETPKPVVDIVQTHVEQAIKPAEPDTTKPKKKVVKKSEKSEKPV